MKGCLDLAKYFNDKRVDEKMEVCNFHSQFRNDVNDYHKAYDDFWYYGDECVGKFKFEPFVSKYGKITRNVLFTPPTPIEYIEFKAVILKPLD